jgi:hypothetical protein
MMKKGEQIRKKMKKQKVLSNAHFQHSSGLSVRGDSRI